MNFVGQLPSGKRVYVRADKKKGDRVHGPTRGTPLAFAVFIVRANGRTEIVARIADALRTPALTWNGNGYSKNERILTPSEQAEEDAGWWRRHSLKSRESSVRLSPGDVVEVHVVMLRPVRARGAS